MSLQQKFLFWNFLKYMCMNVFINIGVKLKYEIAV